MARPGKVQPAGAATTYRRSARARVDRQGELRGPMPGPLQTVVPDLIRDPRDVGMNYGQFVSLSDRDGLHDALADMHELSSSHRRALVPH